MADKELINSDDLINVSGGLQPTNNKCECPKGYTNICEKCFRADCGKQTSESLVPGKVKIKCNVYDKVILYNFVDKTILKTY